MITKYGIAQIRVIVSSGDNMILTEYEIRLLLKLIYAELQKPTFKHEINTLEQLVTMLNKEITS